jgi:hypothetical protein
LLVFSQAIVACLIRRQIFPELRSEFRSWGRCACSVKASARIGSIVASAKEAPLRVTTIAALAILLSATGRASAQTIEYQPVTLDIPVAGTTLTNLQDLNNRGEVIANLITFPDSTGFEVIAAGRARRHHGVITLETTFSCANLPFTSTQGYSINARGDTVGACSMGPLGSDPRHGFLRDRKGHVLYIDVPGATQTIPTGISNHRQVVGFYVDPPDFSRSGLYRIHGFTWARGQFERLDLDLPDTYTIPSRVNSRGQIIGEFTRFTPSTNETLQHGWFIYDGQFSFPFPDSLEWMGGPAITLADINDLGEIVGTRSNGGAAWDGPFVYWKGTFFSIQLPSDFEFPLVNGMNDKGEIVGSYRRKAFFDPFYGVWVYAAHGFVAAPAAGPAE